MTIWTSSAVRMPTTRSRVDCGLGLTMLSFWPMMRLSRVDLPALGFPTTVTMPALGIREKVMRFTRVLATNFPEDFHLQADVHAGHTNAKRPWSKTRGVCNEV